MVDQLKGIGVSWGKVTGKVKLVRKPEDLEGFTDEIIVTEMTDPSMVMAINNAKAIITEKGGMLSHPSILARELGIPAVVGVKKALDYLEDGEEVEVDGSQGTINRTGRQIHE